MLQVYIMLLDHKVKQFKVQKSYGYKFKRKENLFVSKSHMALKIIAEKSGNLTFFFLKERPLLEGTQLKRTLLK